MINIIRWAIALPFMVAMFVFMAVAFCITSENWEQTLGEWMDKHL